MHDQSTQTAIERQNSLDGAILGMLICDGYQRLWSADEIGREVQNDPTDSLRRLYGGGLIHRLEGFVWATRAAIIAEEIAQ